MINVVEVRMVEDMPRFRVIVVDTGVLLLVSEYPDGTTGLDLSGGDDVTGEQIRAVGDELAHRGLVIGHQVTGAGREWLASLPVTFIPDPCK